MRMYGKVVRSFLIAAFLVATAAASRSFAQSAAETRGRFTLPFEAHWGTLDLKPGTYSFALRKESGITLFTVEQGQQRIGWVLTSYTGAIDPGQRPDAEFFCTRNAGACAIHALVMPWRGVYYFNVPGASKQFQAQQTPGSTETVPVLLAQK
jgi:hypothetical protein